MRTSVTGSRAFGFLVSVLPILWSPDVTSSEFDLPIWSRHHIEGDTLFFISEDQHRSATASLLFVPSNTPKLESAARALQYESGRDFKWMPGSRTIEILPGSRIPFKTRGEMYPERTSTDWATDRRGNYLLFREGHFFHDLQIVASYETREAWDGAIPSRQRTIFPHTRFKLENRLPITLVVLGDSISTGLNASGVVGSSPYQPGYPTLVARGLNALGASDVTLKNLSVSGTTSAWGRSQIPAVISLQPDLLVIAFGMNDAINISAATYAENVASIVNAVRKEQVNCEFVLVAPMIGNAEWSALLPEAFLAYRNELVALQSPGVGVADVTTFWSEVLKRKNFYDLTGNGLNHPNDFGHQIYSNVILELFR